MPNLKFDFSRHISSRGTKKSQFLNSDEEKPVSPEKRHSMGTFLTFFGRYWFFFVWLVGFSSYRAMICAAGQSLVRAPPLGGAPCPCGLTYLSKPARGDIGEDYKTNK